VRQAGSSHCPNDFGDAWTLAQLATSGGSVLLQKAISTAGSRPSSA